MGEIKIYPGVKLGKDVRIEEWVEIGVPPRDQTEEILETVIGDNTFIRSKTIIYAGTKAGKNFFTGHMVIIRERCIIGDNVSIGTGSVLERDVKIGNGVRIHSQVFIPEYTEIEDEAWIGPRVVITNCLHPLCPLSKKCLKGPLIRKKAIIGANAVLLPGIVIGENAFVGAGSVVTSDVPDGKVVAGNPARIIKDISELKCPYDLIDKPYG